jgi:tyrosinase
MWQTIHADKWGASQRAPHSTWAVPSGAQLDMDYPLKPFNKDASSYWTSNDVKDWTALGYTYPEFSTSDGSRASITRFVNALYGSVPSLSAGDVSAQIAPPAVNLTDSEESINAGRNTNSTKSAGSVDSFNRTSVLPSSTRTASGSQASSYATTSGLFPLISSLVGGVENLLDTFLDSTGAAYEYACNIQTPRYALNGSYYIYVFNGAPASDNPSTWVTDANLAGLMGVLAYPESMGDSTLIVTGSIPLTRSLRSKVTLGSLISMAFDIILPYLTKNVEWRIVKDGQEVDVDSVEGFKASIYSSLVKSSGNTGDLPSYSDYTPQLEVTKDKKGGADQAIFGTAEENKSGNSVSSGGDSSSGSTGSYGNASPENSAPSYTSSEAEASSPATASAHESVPGSSAANTCIGSTSTTTVQEVETVYVTASSPPVQETQPASTVVESTQPTSSVVVETHPVASPSAETSAVVKPYPIPSASSKADAIYPTASGAPTAPVYQPSGTGGKV